MVGNDLDLLPTGIEELADARGDPVDLVVEIVDEPDADVVSPMVDVADLGPGGTGRIAGLGGPEPARRCRPSAHGGPGSTPSCP